MQHVDQNDKTRQEYWVEEWTEADKARKELRTKIESKYT